MRPSRRTRAFEWLNPIDGPRNAGILGGALQCFDQRHKETRAIPVEAGRLLEQADTKVETYSRGMKQRLHLARGLIANARVLFLDEPTIGMDPIATKDFRILVKDLKNEGRTILLTTHDMTEAEARCDRVALIDKGRLLAVETPASLAQLVSKHEKIDFEAADGGLARQIRQQPGISSVTPLAGATTFRVELSDPLSVSTALQFLVSSGVTSIRTSRPSLENSMFTSLAITD